MKTIVISMLMVMSAGSFANAACSTWVADNSVSCEFGDMESGIPWKRQCPDSVCQRDGKYVKHIPCDNEEICMPKSRTDGPRIPGAGVPEVQTNPNKLGTICQMWYPINSVDGDRAGCDTRKHEIIWTRECQVFGGTRTLPTRTCSAGYPNEN